MSDLGGSGNIFGALNDAWDFGFRIGDALFGSRRSRSSSTQAQLPAWAQQGTPNYGEWAYAGVPTGRLVVIDKTTGGHKVFGPQQGAGLALSDLPALPAGSVMTIDPATAKRGILNAAAVKRAMEGCPVTCPECPTCPTNATPTMTELPQVVKRVELYTPTRSELAARGELDASNALSWLPEAALGQLEGAWDWLRGPARPDESPAAQRLRQRVQEAEQQPQFSTGGTMEQQQQQQQQQLPQQACLPVCPTACPSAPAAPGPPRGPRGPYRKKPPPVVVTVVNEGCCDMSAIQPNSRKGKGRTPRRPGRSVKRRAARKPAPQMYGPPAPPRAARAKKPKTTRQFSPAQLANQRRFAAEAKAKRARNNRPTGPGV